MIVSNSNQFSLAILSIKSTSPTYSAPASRASAAFGPLVKTKTLTSFPVPFGKATAPLNCWSAFLVSKFNLTATSTDPSKEVTEVSLTNLAASSLA